MNDTESLPGVLEGLAPRDVNLDEILLQLAELLPHDLVDVMSSWLLIGVQSNSQTDCVHILRNIADLNFRKLLGFLGVIFTMDTSMCSLHLRFVTKSIKK